MPDMAQQHFDDVWGHVETIVQRGRERSPDVVQHPRRSATRRSSATLAASSVRIRTPGRSMTRLRREQRPHQRRNRHQMRAAVLGARGRQRDEVGREVDLGPAQAADLAPAQASRTSSLRIVPY